MLTTTLRPSGGTARVAGHDVVAEPHEVRRRIGVVFQGPSLELQLSARQNLRFHAKLYGVPRAEQRVQDMLRWAELEARAHEPVYNFSGGMRRRLELARAVLHGPEVLFLDEPTIGLDPQARLHTWGLLQSLQKEGGMALLLTTHDMAEADRLAQRVAIMDHGKVLADDTPRALKDALGREVVELRLAGPAAKAAERLQRVPGVLKVEQQGSVARVHVARLESALPRIVEVATSDGSALEGMELHRPTLEDVFIERTGRALREGA
jgi:ABC-2 type transport system ATP-binding protein